MAIPTSCETWLVRIGNDLRLVDVMGLPTNKKWLCLDRETERFVTLREDRFVRKWDASYVD